MSIKKSNDTIGNRTRDLPTCSAVPQPTAPPRAPIHIYSCVLTFKRLLFNFVIWLTQRGCRTSKLTFDCWHRHFFRARRSCMLPTRGLRFQLWFKISYPCFIFGNSSVQKLPTFCLTRPQQFFWDPLASFFSVLRSADAEPTLQRLFSAAKFNP